MRNIFLLVTVLLLQTPEHNLVKNGTFDRNLSGWTLGSGEWALDKSTDSGAAKVLNPHYRSRNIPGLRIEDVFGIWQCVKIDKTQDYELRMRSRMSSDFSKVGYGAASLTWFSNGDCSIRPNPRRSGIIRVPDRVKLADADGDWHELALTAVHPPSNARSVKIMLESVATQPDDQRTIEVWFDDIIFRAVDK